MQNAKVSSFIKGDKRFYEPHFPPPFFFEDVDANLFLKPVGIPTKARAGFDLKGWILGGRPLQGQGFGKHFQTRFDRSEYD